MINPIMVASKSYLLVFAALLAITVQSAQDATGNAVQIHHFNDCYNLKDVPRFKTLLDQVRPPSQKDASILVFGGDLLSPNTQKAWEPMAELSKTFGIDVACLGNHECDYGYKEFMRAKEYLHPENGGFPWIMCNVFMDKKKTQRIGKCYPYKIINRNGSKVGFIGYADKSWEYKMNYKMRDTPIYVESALNVLPQHIAELKKQECDFIVLVSHSNWDSDDPDQVADVDVAEALGNEIDMILTGHDHFMKIKLINGTPILNSGSHYQWMTTTNITVHPDNQLTALRLETHDNTKEIDYKEGADAAGWCSREPSDDSPACKEAENNAGKCSKCGADWIIEPPREQLTYLARKPVRNGTGTRILQFDITKYRVNDSIAEHQPTVDFITPHIERLKKFQAFPIARALKEYNPKGVREGPNAIAKGLLEILRKHVYAGNVHADLAALHAGSFRRSEVLKPGEITRGDILSILKFDEPTCVIKVTGKMLWDLMQKSESKFATGKTAKSGKKSASGYLQVAGVEYKTDGDHRIIRMQVRGLTGKVSPVTRDHSSTWRIATSKYIADCIDTPKTIEACPMATIAARARGYLFRKFGEKYGTALDNSIALSWNGNPSAFEVVRRYYESQISESRDLPIFLEEPFSDDEGWVFEGGASAPPALMSDHSDDDDTDSESEMDIEDETASSRQKRQGDLHNGLHLYRYKTCGDYRNPSIWMSAGDRSNRRHFERMSRGLHAPSAKELHA